MKKIITLVAVAGVVFGLSQATPVVAHAGQSHSGHIFSGMMGNYIDGDGDGIPNGQDPDFVRSQDGSGVAAGKGVGTGSCDTTGPKGSAKRGR
jgi:hypothetical protein